MTIKDIARESGYAVGTVSRALNNHPNVSPAAREKIMEVVRRTGFRPNSNARRLKQQASHSIAVVVKGAHNLLFAAMVETIQALVKAKGYSVIVSYQGEEDDEVSAAHALCGEHKPLGVLFLGGNRDNLRRCGQEVSCPCAVVSTRADDLELNRLSSVSTDDAAGSRRAMEYLLEAGHREIGVIGGESAVVGQELACNTSQLRLAGCVAACRERGVPFDPARRTVQVPYSLEGGYTGAKLLLRRCPELTAIFAMSDVMAMGAIRAVRELGRSVPGDVSVMGYDGIELAGYCNPKLTTIRQDWETLAHRGVELLLGAIEKDSPAAHEIIPFQLEEGESVKRI